MSYVISVIICGDPTERSKEKAVLSEMIAHHNGSPEITNTGEIVDKSRLGAEEYEFM